MTMADAFAMAEQITIIGEGRLADNPLSNFIVREGDGHLKSFELGIAHERANRQKEQP